MISSLFWHGLRPLVFSIWHASWNTRYFDTFCVMKFVVSFVVSIVWKMFANFVMLYLCWFCVIESGCLLPSLPSDATFDKSSGISFLCDLNDNIAAPWPSTTQLPSSSCNKSKFFSLVSLPFKMTM